jgi:hypothetical protein
VWAVSEERREEERHAVRCHGISKSGEQCKVLSCHSYEHAWPLKHGAMFCVYHTSQGQEAGWRERLADVQDNERYAVSPWRVSVPPTFGPSSV